MIECNVLIVGCGLSGASAAYSLTKAGVKDVVVIERMSGDAYSHYHRTCGEAVSDRMIDASEIPKDCIVRAVSRIRLICGDTVINVPVKGRIIDRNSLLSTLKGLSDASFVKDSVKSVRKDPRGFVVTCADGEYLCRYLIGADGAFSAVRKELFDVRPEMCFPIVNNLVSGDSDTEDLIFEVSDKYPGTYRWDFPSKDGLRSKGYALGNDDIGDYSERGIRFFVSGSSRRVVDGNCCLVGDAGMLANPLCFGGIGIALLTGKKAAECISRGDLTQYQRWVNKDVIFDHHYMAAHEEFSQWTGQQIVDAVKPLSKGYSVLRGAYAILRRPRWANVYMSLWMAFRHGW